MDYTNYKILKYYYSHGVAEMSELLWDKMTPEESKWAIVLTRTGINDTGGDDNRSWDIFFLEDKLKEKIESVLNKYNIKFTIKDITDQLLSNNNEITENLISKLNKHLTENLTVNSVLDKIIDQGIKSLSVFEKYYLENKTEE